jgi:hypothetical protein
LQYDNEEPSYDEYEGYMPPSDDKELEYIQAMSDEANASLSFNKLSSSSPITKLSMSSSSSVTSMSSFDNIKWQPRLEALRACYQCTPWVHRATWEFTPHDGITHIRNCNWCAKYKEHLTIAEAMKNITHDPTYESAWSICDQYEQKLIQLGWDLAHEGGQLSELEIKCWNSGTTNYKFRWMAGVTQTAVRPKNKMSSLRHSSVNA